MRCLSPLEAMLMGGLAPPCPLNGSAVVLREFHRELADVLFRSPAPKLGLGVVLFEVVQENNEVLQDVVVVVVDEHGRSSVCAVPISAGGNINKTKKERTFSS